MLSEDDVKMLTDTNIAFIATVNKDGSPQVTPVWIHMEGDLIIVNTEVGRVKQLNVERDPRVSISLVDKNDPYKFLGLDGTVIEQTTAGADSGIDALSKKYLNKDNYPFRKPDEKRITLKIRPERKYKFEG